MTSQRKSLTAKSVKKTNKGSSFPQGVQLRRGAWLTLPLGILTALCLYVMSLSSWNLSFSSTLLMQPNVAALLIAAFSVTYIYKLIGRRQLSIFAKIPAYALSIFLLLTLLWIALGSGQPCTGFFGAQTDCSSVYYFKLWLVFFNPFVAPVLSILSMLGTVAIFIKSRTKK